MKTMRIRMTYQDGKIYHWTIRRVAEGWNLIPGHKPRKMSGWEFTDHEGCTRFEEGNWMELVARFHATAANYDMTCNLS